MESFEYKGYWYLPNKPDRKIAGILSFKDGESSTLELIGDIDIVTQKDKEEFAIPIAIANEKELINLCELLVSRRVNVIKTNSFEESQVTSGGISFNDIFFHNNIVPQNKNNPKYGEIKSIY